MASAPINIEPTPAAAPAAAPAAPAAPAAAPSAMDQFDAEYGGVVIDGDNNAVAKETPAAAPVEPAPEPASEELTPEQKLEAAERRAEEAERRVRDLTREPEARVQPPKPEAQPQAEDDPRPNAENYTYGEADSAYIEALSRWGARQEHKQLVAQENLQKEITSIETRWKDQTSSEEIKELYPDFDAVVTKGADDGKWDCTPLMALGIKQSPVGPHVAYELAKNPAEAARIASVDNPVEQAYQFGLLEGRIAARVGAKAAEPAPEPRLASGAPTPPANRSRGGSSGAQSSNDISGIQDRMLKEFR